MASDAIQSKAFQQAALRSEELRIKGLLVLLGILFVYGVVRTIGLGSLRLLVANVLIVLLAIGYEVFMLRYLRRAQTEGRDVPSFVWIVNVLIETQIPTLVLVVLIRNQVMPPFQVLVAPAILTYFLYIILSTLRLNPMLSVLSGLMSGLGYLAVAGYTLLTFPDEAAAFPSLIYFAYAGLIVLSGFVAAFVAGQIRGHVTAALREADLQRELERVNHDLDTARSIQQGLFPKSAPELEEFDLAGWNKPADETGGDYFDWQVLPDGRVAISLADATGHGIGPALVSTSCRAYARASLLTAGAHDGVLDRLNGLLAEDLPSNRFITLAVIFLDPKTSKVDIMSAGHGPILWYKNATGEVTALDAQGIPLGMIAGIPYTGATEGTLEPGDILAVATDGFFEWENPEGEQFGIPRMETVIKEGCELSSEEIIFNLREAVDKFSRGTAQADDLTAVVLRRRSTKGAAVI